MNLLLPAIKGSDLSLQIREIRHQPRAANTTATQSFHREGPEYSCTTGPVKAPKRFKRKKFRPPPLTYAQIGQMVLTKDRGEQENHVTVMPKPLKTPK